MSHLNVARFKRVAGGTASLVSFLCVLATSSPALAQDPLTTVAHDSTLSGAGTDAAPSLVAVPLRLTSPSDFAILGSSGTSAGVICMTDFGEEGDIAGVQGVAFSENGKGVFGLGAGVGARAIGVLGRSINGTGVRGETMSPTSVGVYGSNDGGGWAGYFNGKVQVNGSLSVESGVNNRGGGLKHLRVPFSPFGINTCAYGTVSWPTPFADANYTVTATVELTVDSGEATVLPNITNKTPSRVGLKICVAGRDGYGVTGYVHFIAIHD